MEKKTLILALKFLWQLPQELLACMLLPFVATAYCMRYRESFVFYWYFSGAMSLGHVIFISPSMAQYDGNIRHEYGHTIQGNMLGPLYLFVIALPSILWACYHRFNRSHPYEWFYTEKWATALGDKHVGEID